MDDVITRGVLLNWRLSAWVADDFTLTIRSQLVGSSLETNCICLGLEEVHVTIPL